MASARLLFVCTQDSGSGLQTANLIKDIRVERFHKIDMGLKALEGPITVKLNNVSAMECNMIRHFFQGALNQFHKLAQVRHYLACFAGRFWCSATLLLVVQHTVLLVEPQCLNAPLEPKDTGCRWRSLRTWECWEQLPLRKHSKRTDRHPDNSAGHKDELLVYLYISLVLFRCECICDVGTAKLSVDNHASCIITHACQPCLLQFAAFRDHLNLELMGSEVYHIKSI